MLDIARIANEAMADRDVHPALQPGHDDKPIATGSKEQPAAATKKDAKKPEGPVKFTPLGQTDAGKKMVSRHTGPAVKQPGRHEEEMNMGGQTQ